MQDILDINFHHNGIHRRDFLKLTAGTGLVSMFSSCGHRSQVFVMPKRSATWAQVTDETQLKRVFEKALSNGGDYCDIYFQHRQQLALGLEECLVNSAKTSIDMGAGIRVIQAGQTGYAFTESLDEASLLAAAEMAAAVASGSPSKVKWPHRVSPMPVYYPNTPLFSHLDPSVRVRMLLELDAEIRKHPEIIKVAMYYLDEEDSIYHVDSLGRCFRDERPMVVLRVTVTATRNGKIETNGYNCSARAGFDFFSPERKKKIVSEVLRRTLVLFDAVPGPAGQYPLVLAPGSSGILLHEAIGHGMEADFAKAKTTIYTDKIGKKIAPDFVTIVDDGTLPNMRGSIHRDDEGETSARTVLVENGIFRTFMHDRICAEHFRVTPTGNGRRDSFRHMPIPRMRNTYMLAGPHDPKDIIAAVKNGIYAETFTNGQVAIGAGDFTFYIKNGNLIENGRIGAPIKDVNIIGNGPRVLESITMVGNDFAFDEGAWTCGKRGQQVPVGLGMPTVAVSSITVGGIRR